MAVFKWMSVFYGVPADACSRKSIFQTILLLCLSEAQLPREPLSPAALNIIFWLFLPTCCQHDSQTCIKLDNDCLRSWTGLCRISLSIRDLRMLKRVQLWHFRKQVTPPVGWDTEPIRWIKGIKLHFECECCKREKKNLEQKFDSWCCSRSGINATICTVYAKRLPEVRLTCSIT